MALGGRKATRGRRDIHVDGTTYYWRLHNDDRSSMREGKHGVIIGRADRPHQRVIASGPGLSYTINVPGVRYSSHSSVRPGLVRELILFARANGWPAAAPVLTVVCDEDGRLSVA